MIIRVKLVIVKIKTKPAISKQRKNFKMLLKLFTHAPKKKYKEIQSTWKPCFAILKTASLEITFQTAAHTIMLRDSGTICNDLLLV